MYRIDLLKKLQEEVFQSDKEIYEDTILDNLEEWDSMAFINLLALFDDHFEETITTEQVESCRTVSDLINLVIKS